MYEPSVGFEPSTILSGLLLIPYLCWGVYLLRWQLRHHADLPIVVESLTAAGLIVFFVFETTLLRMWLSQSPIVFFIAFSGLVVSCAALYGPMLFSLASHLIIDVVMPHGQKRVQEPQYGTAEGFERNGLFEDAANTYVSVARMFPKEATPALRAADNFMKIGNTEDAVIWFEQGLANLTTPKEALTVAFRLFEIYARMLHDNARARTVLEGFLSRFPDSEHEESVRRRLARLEESRSGSGIRRKNGTPGSWQFEHD